MSNGFDPDCCHRIDSNIVLVGQVLGMALDLHKDILVGIHFSLVLLLQLEQLSKQLLLWHIFAFLLVHLMNGSTCRYPSAADSSSDSFRSQAAVANIGCLGHLVWLCSMSCQYFVGASSLVLLLAAFFLNPWVAREYCSSHSL